MVQAFVYSAHSSPHDYEDDASGQYMGLASCMKYACFADNFFLLICFFVPCRSTYHGVRRHQVVPFYHPTIDASWPSSWLSYYNITHQRCVRGQTKFGKANRHFSESSFIHFRGLLPRLIRTIEVGVFDFGLPSSYLKRIITAYHRNHSCDSYFLLSFSSRDSHLEQKWYCYWSCSASTHSGRNVRIILEM